MGFRVQGLGCRVYGFRIQGCLQGFDKVVLVSLSGLYELTWKTCNPIVTP